MDRHKDSGPANGSSPYLSQTRSELPPSFSHCLLLPLCRWSKPLGLGAPSPGLWTVSSLGLVPSSLHFSSRHTLSHISRASGGWGGGRMHSPVCSYNEHLLYDFSSEMLIRCNFFTLFLFLAHCTWGVGECTQRSTCPTQALSLPPGPQSVEVTAGAKRCSALRIPVTLQGSWQRCSGPLLFLGWLFGL